MNMPEDRGMIGTVGPIEVDWPRAVGYYAGITAAVALGVFDLPIGLFIAAVPFFKMLNRPSATFPERVVGAVLQGASQPVGGDADQAVRVKSSDPGSRRGFIVSLVTDQTKSIWTDARRLNGTASTSKDGAEI